MFSSPLSTARSTEPSALSFVQVLLERSGQHAHIRGLASRGQWLLAKLSASLVCTNLTSQLSTEDSAWVRGSRNGTHQGLQVSEEGGDSELPVPSKLQHGR